MVVRVPLLLLELCLLMLLPPHLIYLVVPPLHNLVYLFYGCYIIIVSNGADAVASVAVLNSDSF